MNTPTNIMTPDIDLRSVWGMFISPINPQANYLLSNASIPDILHFAACNLPFCVPEVPPPPPPEEPPPLVLLPERRFSSERRASLAPFGGTDRRAHPFGRRAIDRPQ